MKLIYHIVLHYYFLNHEHFLQFNYHNDFRVKAFVNSEMIPKEMMPLAGIYINFARRVNISLMPHAAAQHSRRMLYDQQQQRDAEDTMVFCNIARWSDYDRMHTRVHANVVNIRRIFAHRS